jgi:predicted RNA-binding Zn ribbon-like protein
MASKLQAAPGELEHVRAFVNTIDIEDGAEQLDSPRSLGAWLTAHDLGGPDLDANGADATGADLAHARELREALRAILLAHNGDSTPPLEAAATLEAAAERARIRLRFDDRCSTALEPAAGGVDGALGRLLAIVHGAIADGTWRRLKACREHTCEWAFYDHTKNRSGAWCNMAVCGNRAKARAYRERQAAPRTA